MASASQSHTSVLVSSLLLQLAASLFRLSLGAVPHGLYELQNFGLSRPSLCPGIETISVLRANSPNTLRASAIELNGKDRCSGNPLRYKRYPANPPMSPEIVEALLTSELQCGPTQFEAPSRLFFVRFLTDTSEKDLPVDWLTGSSFPSASSEADADVDPDQSIAPSLPSTPSATPSATASASPSPEVFIFLANVFYLLSTDKSPCIFRRLGDHSPSPTSTPTPSVSSLEEDPPAPSDDEEPSESPDSDNGPVCFPGSARVALLDGSVVPMERVQIGDVVQTGPNRYSTVFAWTHRLPAGSIHSRKYMYIQLHTDLANPLVLTPSHYVYIHSKHQKQPRAVPAHDVRPGDRLIAHDGALLPVRNTSTTYINGGLYNPQTEDGDIVVNGVQASTYTTAIRPNTAHALLAPLRAAFRTIVAARSCVTAA